MLIRVELSNQKLVLLGKVNGTSFNQDVLLNAPEYFDVIFVVLADIIISGTFCKE